MSEKKTIYEIVDQYFSEKGFSGWYDPYDPKCTCTVDEGRISCASADGCLPGYKHPDGSIRPEKFEHKRCPFCGGEARVFGGDTCYWVSCVECPASMHPRESIDEAWKAWDTRVEAPK